VHVKEIPYPHLLLKFGPKNRKISNQISLPPKAILPKKTQLGPLGVNTLKKNSINSFLKR